MRILNLNDAHLRLGTLSGQHGGFLCFILDVQEVHGAFVFPCRPVLCMSGSCRVDARFRLGLKRRHPGFGGGGVVKFEPNPSMSLKPLHPMTLNPKRG